MKKNKGSLFIIMFILGSALCASLYAQPQKKLLCVPGKVFITKSMANFEILSDSTLYWNSSHLSIYKIKNDTLFIKEAYTWYGPNHTSGYTVNYHGFKILKANNDTISLKNNYQGEYSKPDDWEDPLVFIDIEKLKQPVNNFKYIEMSHNNIFAGSVVVTVDSVGKITFFTDSVTMITKEKKDKWTGLFSPSEFENFKNVLSKSFIMSLPVMRGCGIDQPQTWFTVKMNNKKFTTKGCYMYYPQQLLLNYLDSLDKNDGVKNKREDK